MDKSLKKFVKITALVTLSVFLLVTLVVHMLPFFIDANEYKEQVCSEFNNATGMVLELDRINFSVLPLYNAHLSLKDVEIKSKLKEEIFDAKRVEVSVPILPLAFKTLKIGEIKVDSPDLYLIKLKDGSLDIKKKLPPAPKSKVDAKKDFAIDLKGLKIALQNYSVEYVDKSAPVVLRSNLFGKNLFLKNFDPYGKMEFIADGVFGINGSENLSYDVKSVIDLKMFQAPKVVQNNHKNKQEINNKKPFNFLYAVYKNNIKADLKADLIIDDFDDIEGEVLLDKLSLMVNKTQLPNSRLCLKAHNGRFSADSKIFIRKGASIAINGDISPKELDLKVKSSLIKLADVKELSKVVFSALGNSTNELNKIKIDGDFIANLDLRSDFKSLKSSGYLKVNNTNLSYRGITPSVSAFNADVRMKDNNIVISKTGGFFSGDRFDLSGKIDSKTNTDVFLTIPNLRLRPLFDEYKKQSKMDILKPVSLSGNTGLKLVLKGKLNELEPKTQMLLKNILFTHKDFALPLNITEGKLFADNKQLNLNIPCAKLNNSLFDITGKVPFSLSKINLIATGKLRNKDLARILGVESVGEGVVPANLNVWGSAKNINLNAQILNTKNNYVLVSDIGTNNLINAHLLFDENRIDFQDVSLKKTSNTSLNSDFTANLKGVQDVAFVEGSIVGLDNNPKFKKVMVKANTPVKISIPVGENAAASVQGLIAIKGFLKEPMMDGNIKITSLKIPALKASINKINVNLKDKMLMVNVPNALVGKSSLSAKCNVDIKDLDPVVVTDLMINSDYFDADEFFVLLGSLAPKNSKPQAHAGYSLKKKYVPNVSPVVIKDGKFVADRFIINKVNCIDLKTALELDRYNLFTADKLRTVALAGIIEGAVSYDISTSKTGIKINADGVNVNEFMVKFLGLPKDQIKGQGFAKVDISFKGSANDDIVRSMQGEVAFDVKDGEMGDLGRIDHYLSAANIISNNLLSLNLNRIINGVSMKKTGQFKKAYGKLVFIRGGIMRVDHLKTEGPKLSIYIRGDVNNVNSYGSLDIYGRLSQEVVKVLGPIGDFSIDKLMKKVPILSELSKHGIGLLETEVPANLRKQIPPLSEDSTESQEFRAKIKGNIYKASSVKSFRWIKDPKTVVPVQVEKPMSSQQSQSPKSDVEMLLDTSKQIFSIFQDQTSH